tara:strand:+ start:5215 stop:5463 length:249 start_codon:yes stop_codon:yes gene_type:complete
MANIKAKIRQTNTIKGKATKNNEIVAQTVKLSQGSLSLGDLTDVDTATASDGSVLQFNGTTARFESTNNVENENLTIGGGVF